MRPFHLFFPATSLIVAISCGKPEYIYPERKMIIEAVYASGKIVAEDEFKLSAQSHGTIEKKLIRDGDSVCKGQLLYVVNSAGATEQHAAAMKTYAIAKINLSQTSPLLTDLKLNLQSAEIKARNDSIMYQRLANLWERNIGTRNNLDNSFTNYQLSVNQKENARQKYYTALNQAKVAYENAIAQLSASRKALGDYYISSPQAGIVFQTFKETGETVTPDEIVALIGKRDSRIVKLAVDQQDINKIRIGQQVLLQTDVTGKQVFEALVNFIYPVMNEADQTFRVDAVFKKVPDHPFIFGSVEANIVIQTKHNALVLPTKVFEDTNSVWISDDKGLRKITVTKGISTFEYTEVLSGLNERTPVIAGQKN